MSWKLFFSYEFMNDVGISVGIFVLFLLFRKLFAKYVVTDVLFWQEIDGIICPDSDGKPDHKKGEAHTFFSFPFN